MKSKPLGNDVYLSFLVKVGRSPALIDSAKVKVLKNDNIISESPATLKKNKVSIVVPANIIKSTGDYVALFEIRLTDMGKQEYAEPFRITESALGKKRQ